MSVSACRKMTTGGWEVPDSATQEGRPRPGRPVRADLDVKGMSTRQSPKQTVSAGDLRGNRLLDALPGQDRARLADAMHVENHGLKDVLLEPGQPIRYVYFPVTAVVSILTGMEDGSAVEIATIGNEGMVGASIVIGARETVPRQLTQVQVPGTVIRVDADRFSREATDGALRDLAGRYLQAFLAQVSQQVACNGLHSVEERCSRWMLLTHDRVKRRVPSHAGVSLADAGRTTGTGDVAAG